MNESVIDLLEVFSELIGEILSYELTTNPAAAFRLGPIIDHHKMLDVRLGEEKAKLKA